MSLPLLLCMGVLYVQSGCMQALCLSTRTLLLGLAPEGGSHSFMGEA